MYFQAWQKKNPKQPLTIFCAKLRFEGNEQNELQITFALKIRTLNSRLVFTLALFLFAVISFAQERITTEEYIDMYKDVAIKKMKEYKIPASITLAQGILESGSGNSKLARKANNHFGIKCHKGWNGKTFYMDDDAKNECFRKYKNASDSYRDHSLFLTQRGRYTFLFDYEITDYDRWAHGLKKAGYATNPKYPKLLISIIERYNLDRFDKGGKAKKKKAKGESKTTVSAVSPTVTMAAMLANLSPVATSIEGRDVFENNGTRFVVVEQGDTFYGIAEEFDIYTWQLYKYNEVKKDHILQIDEILYLEKKKKKADKQFKSHLVQEGETLRFISQLYGIRLKRLLKMNSLEDTDKLQAGESLRLR
jgi:LysM repeat protein